jgi:hypothetical protein
MHKTVEDFEKMINNKDAFDFDKEGPDLLNDVIVKGKHEFV